MNNERKKESLWVRIKLFFKHLFKKNKLKELPEGSIVNVEDEQKNTIEIINNEADNHQEEQNTEVNNCQEVKNTEELNGNIETIGETDNQEEQINQTRSKEEILKMYKDVKEKKLDPNTLTENELKIFIQIAKQELNFLNKKIDEEKAQFNLYKEKIAY